MEKPILWSNAEVVTLDSALPRASAFVTKGEELVYVGDEAGAKDHAGPEARTEDLGGRTVVPGFNDNHLHLVFFGDHTYAPDLSGLNEKTIVDRVAAFSKTVPLRSPVVAYAWDYPACPQPRKELLDEAFPNRPVILAQFGGHAVWVNSFVLRAMGIDRYHSPPTGQVLRDDEGEPTGVLREMSQTPVMNQHFRSLFFRRSLREPRIRRSFDEFRRLGITSIQDNTWYHPVLSTLHQLYRRDELTARVSCWSFGRVPSSVPSMNRGPYHGEWVRRGPRKYFLDGTFTTRTAWMDEMYPGYPNDHGMGFDPAWLESVLERLVRLRLQGAFHSIGDRSTGTFLDVWEKVVERHPEATALRMRLEHVQAVRPADFERMRRLGVCAAVQPPALATPEKDAAIVGADRALNCYPHRSLLDAGVALSFGSDIPGEAFCDPLRGMHLVCNRPGDQRIEPLEALKAYTQGSAFVEFQEGRKGTLKPGFLADFTVLSDNPTTVDRRQLQNIAVERTVVGGRTVWDRNSEILT
jgi:predicted amidohydrolase YtcJ